LDNGYGEVLISGRHAAATAHLEAHHKDPFDRMLVAQASEEELLLVTADKKLSEYPGPIRLV
jgi:PIN domain nuclease of toxin-antitoxin system